LSVDVIGKHIDILFPVETREQSLVHIQEATVGKRWEVVEIGIGHVNGAVYTLLWNSAAIYMSDGKTIRSIIAQGHDITIRTQLAIELKKSEEKYKSLFENVSDAIFVYDPDTFIITEVNDATSRLYGYEKAELIGMSCLKFSAEEDKSKQVADK
jgi:PAS fold.